MCIMNYKLTYCNVYHCLVDNLLKLFVMKLIWMKKDFDLKFTFLSLKRLVLWPNSWTILHIESNCTAFFFISFLPLPTLITFKLQMSICSNGLHPKGYTIRTLTLFPDFAYFILPQYTILMKYEYSHNRNHNVHFPRFSAEVSKEVNHYVYTANFSNKKFIWNTYENIWKLHTCTNHTRINFISMYNPLICRIYAKQLCVYLIYTWQNLLCTSTGVCIRSLTLTSFCVMLFLHIFW